MVWEDWAEILRANPAGRAMLNWGGHNAQCLPVWKQSWAQVVPMLGQVGPMLNHPDVILDLRWAKSGPCWALLGPSWAYIGPGWAYVGPILGPCPAYVGPMLVYVGPMLAHLDPSWQLCWGHGPCLGQLCWNDLKMQFFPPRAPSWSPKPRKNRCFLTSPRWNPLPPKGPKHRKKNNVFEYTASKIHRKQQGLQSGGVSAG